MQPTSASSNPDAAPRAYRSELRAQQAQETRRRILRAAASLFATHGYQATTLAAIAREAGVSTETVKAAASKAELLIGAFEVTFAGSEAAESLTETEVGAGVLDLPDDEFLGAMIGQIVTANARGYALWTVLLGAAASDPIVGDALQGILRHRASDYRMAVSALVDRGYAEAVSDLDATAAVLSFVMSPEGYQQLVVQSGWSEDRYTAWLHATILENIGA